MPEIVRFHQIGGPENLVVRASPDREPFVARVHIIERLTARKVEFIEMPVIAGNRIITAQYRPHLAFALEPRSLAIDVAQNVVPRKELLAITDQAQMNPVQHRSKRGF